MKKIFNTIIIIVFAALNTFVIFEQLSWYHFGDMPTKVVLFRLIFVFLIFILILYLIAYSINKIKCKKTS